MRISFEREAFADFNEWAANDPKTYAKLVDLIEAIERNPFTGIGKPEPLKHNFRGHWSRRITQDHRLVYRVTESEVIIVSCKEHY